MSVFDSIVRTTLPITPKPVVHFFARRYVAGATLNDAVATVRRLANEGCCATLDVLGESVSERAHAATAVASYHEVIETIAAESLPANISLKPTQMGLNIDYGFCRDNVTAILERAAANRIFVRIDMEDSPTTDATLRLYHELIARFPKGTGVVLQARMRRTLADAASLAAEGASVRLCKGIYLEPRSIAYEEREIIRRAFVHALRILLAGSGYTGIATHDELLVCEALGLIRELGVGPDRYEFQMLLGVDPELRRIITSSGHKLRVYVPFGSHWYPYSVRRCRENPSIARAGIDAFLKGRMEA
ncbi:MAG TPA: proline dehydrogenase family protein [Thermoanaerobaculaceae bacterium]|nr:proline dehydrogenase family protein [Thermoanaerobaculaceae bacterium]